MRNNKAQPAGEAIPVTGRLLLDGFSRPHLSLLKVSALAGVFGTVFLCIMWVAFALLAESVVIKGEQLSEQNILITMFVCSALVKVFLVRVQTMFGDTASANIRSDIRKSMLGLWRQQSPLSEHQQSPASAATQWVEDVEAMDGYFSKYWPQQILAVVSPLIILCVVAWINWLCALLLLISAPLIPLFMILVGMGAEHLNQKYSTSRQRLAGHFLNRVANLTTIKLLGAQHSVFEEVESRSTQYREVIMRTLRVAFLSSTVLEFFTSVAIASLAIYIGFSLYGAITWGPAANISLFSGLLILVLAPEFFQPLRILSQYYHDKASALGAANNLTQLFRDTNKKDAQVQLPNIKDNQALAVLSTKQTRLTLNNVSIGYSEKAILVKNLCLDLRGNQLFAITGPSGSGKSTILNTIANYLTPLSGDISMYPGNYSSTPMAYLPQKPWIKNTSLANNITEFAPNASLDEIESCLQELGLSDEFENRVSITDTLIGEHGQGFSGGQMQRIALSRIILNPTAIILLDEPSAKLDMQSKTHIIKALNKLKQKAIVIVATHDAALIEIADSCLQLNKTGEQTHAVLV